MDRDLRSIVAWLLHLLNGIVVTVGAGFMLWLWLKLEDHPAREPVGIGFLAAALLLALNVLRLLYLRRPGDEGEDYILSQAGAGAGVRVAVEAIRSELKAATEQIPEVTRCKVAVFRPGPRRIRVQASYVACEGTNILALSERIRGVLREKFQDMVPLGEGVRLDIEIDFESFGGKAPKKSGEEKPPEAPEPPPFTGPRYPVDGEL